MVPAVGRLIRVLSDEVLLCFWAGDRLFGVLLNAIGAVGLALSFAVVRGLVSGWVAVAVPLIRSVGVVGDSVRSEFGAGRFGA